MQRGILLLQMGGPSSLDEVQPFLFNLFRDPYIIKLPWFMQPFQRQFANFISSRRAPKVQELYKEIGGASPIKFETESQRRALQKYLDKTDTENQNFTYFAMRYTSPFLSEVLPQIQEDKLDELVVLPLYPQYSDATSGSSIAECRELFEQADFHKNTKIRYIESWEDNQFFIDLIVQRILDALNAYKKDSMDFFENPDKVHILFSAHGLPESYVKNGDPYEEQVKRSVALVMGRLPLYKHSISYQSRVGPMKWLQPSTEAEIKKLAKEKLVKNLLVVPISFVGDHIETLQEINLEYKEYAHEQGIKNFRVTRLPKANPLLIKALATSIA